ncbi:hypothetical protein SLS62_000191 [Diatrype stigma]|uniref:Uncharacterized protein n=1 Tax=Diatrype stigma TaxID=117547 RepID=A0AAN9V0I2_9PEZI
MDLPTIRLNWEGRRGKRPEGVIDFGQEVVSPTTPAPAKGFKLVHQYPSSDAPGSRRLEPLTGATAQPKPDRPRAPQHKASLSEGAAPALGDPEAFQRPPKRTRFSVDAQTQTVDLAEKRPYSSRSSTIDSTTASLRFPTNYSAPSSGDSPLTPATSSTYSDDDIRQSVRFDLQGASPPGLRRLSMGSNLSTSPGTRRLQDGLPMLEIDTRPNSTEPSYYGIDRGFADRDLGKNDDHLAISGQSPLLHREFLDTPVEELETFPIEFGFGLETNYIAHELGGYYTKPVSILIPRSLEPLPDK